MERTTLAPPHSIEAEESVIGGILVHAATLLVVLPLVKVDDFYHPALRAIYEAMLELNADSKPVDALTVVEQMRATETFEKLRAFNGADYFIELQSKVVTVENLAYHARIVHAKATRRRWVLKFQELAAAGYRESDDDDFFVDAERELLALAIARQERAGGPRSLQEVVGNYQTLLADRAARRQRTGSGITGIPTGYEDLDVLLSGLQLGDLIIVAGRPSMGKTALAMNMIVNAARRKDEAGESLHPALVFSLEMSEEQLAERMVSGEARIDSQRLRQGDVGPSHWVSITRATGFLAELPIKIETRGTITVAEINSIARVWRMGLPEDAQGVVVIDYMQLVTASGKNKNRSREQDVSEISRGLKQLAKDLKCPVIALSQLSRALEQRTNKRPMLSDLRESGAIEQDADVVAFVYRDEKYNKIEPGQCPRCGPGIAEIIIGKQRMGPCASAHVTFIDQFTRFENLSHRGDAT